MYIEKKKKKLLSLPVFEFMRGFDLLIFCVILATDNTPLSFSFHGNASRRINHSIRVTIVAASISISFLFLEGQNSASPSSICGVTVQAANVSASISIRLQSGLPRQSTK